MIGERLLRSLMKFMMRWLSKRGSGREVGGQL